MQMRLLGVALLATLIAPAFAEAPAVGGIAQAQLFPRDADSDSDSDSDSDGDGGGIFGRTSRRDRDGGIFGRTGRRDRDGGVFDRNGRNGRDDRNGGVRSDGDLGRFCVDRNRDGWCDRGSLTLPEMASAVLIGQGRRDGRWSRWVPANVRNARWVDQDRNGVPERAAFYDARGRVLQTWYDRNRDGRADLIQFIRNGRVVRSIRG
jgi:hypothetical protein